MKNVIKSIIFVIILFFLIEGITYFLIPHQNIKKYGVLKTSLYEILSEEENTIDSLFIGDSLIYSAVSPMEVWHNYGYTMFVEASAAQLINDSYKYLEVGIESQHPQIVFFEANVLYRNPKNKAWYFDLYSKMESSVPILKYHNNWKKVMFKFLNNNDSFKNINVYKGYKYVTKVQSAQIKDYMHVTTKAKKLPAGNEEIFQKMLKLCEKENVELVLVSTPNMRSWNYSKHLGITNLAQKYNIEFIDLNIHNPLNIDWHQETKDMGDHLNHLGAIKVSNFLGQYLQETNLLIDHRGDQKYASWDESYKIYKNNLEEIIG